MACALNKESANKNETMKGDKQGQNAEEVISALLTQLSINYIINIFNL